MKIDIDNNNNQYNFKKINKDKIKNSKYNDAYNNENNNEIEQTVPTITKSHRKFVGNINQNDSSGVSALLNNNNNNYDIIQRNRRERTPINTIKNNGDNSKYYNNYKNRDEKYSNVQYYEQTNYKNENFSSNFSKEENNIVLSNINYNKNYNNNNNNNVRYNNNKRRKITRTKSIDRINNENTINISNFIYNDNNKNNRHYAKLSQKTSFPSESMLLNEKKIDEIEKILIKLQKQRDIYLDEYNKLPEHPKKHKDLNDKKELKKLIDDLNVNINEYKRQERNLKKNQLYL